MKRILLALAFVALVSPAFSPKANADDVSIDFFYNNLSGGSWIEVEGYGYCWQPDLAASDSSWRPYTDGYWAYTDAGWTWVSYEDFGWATYHYGRWTRLTDYGWVWVPGEDLEWGPAWVSWRTGGDYIGWAPLPPREREGREVVYESRPIGPQVDVEFDIGPESYSFCDVRYIGEPVLRGRIVDYRQNVTYINQTVNVTNIRVENNTVYNYGPDITVINQRSSRPIQRLRLERQQNVDLGMAVRSGAATKVQGNSLIVAAPMRLAKPAKQIAPPTVKTKVLQPKIEKGWAGVDPNTQTQIKQKLKTEDHTKIPPPTAGGGAASQQAVSGSSVATTATPVTTPAMGGKGQHPNRVGQQGLQSPTVAAPSTSGANTSPTLPPEPGKQHKGKHEEQLGGNTPIATPTAATQAATTAPEAAMGKHKGRHEQPVTTAPLSTPTAAPQGNVPPGPRGRHQMDHGTVGATPGPTGGSGQNLNEPRRGHNKQLEPTNTPPPQNPGTQNQTGPNTEMRGQERHQAEGVDAAATAAPATSGGGVNPAGAGTSEGKHEKKNKPEKGSPAPTP